MSFWIIDRFKFPLAWFRKVGPIFRFFFRCYPIDFQLLWISFIVLFFVTFSSCNKTASYVLFVRFLRFSAETGDLLSLWLDGIAKLKKMLLQKFPSFQNILLSFQRFLSEIRCYVLLADCYLLFQRNRIWSIVVIIKTVVKYEQSPISDTE